MSDWEQMDKIDKFVEVSLGACCVCYVGVSWWC